MSIIACPWNDIPVWLPWCLQGGKLGDREQEWEGVYFYFIPFKLLNFEPCAYITWFKNLYICIYNIKLYILDYIVNQKTTALSVICN